MQQISKRFKNLPIKNKLMLIMLVTTSLVLLLSVSTFLYREYLNFKASLVDQVSTVAGIVGPNSSAALAFDDKDAAQEILQVLQDDARVVLATIYNIDNELFATYQRSDAKLEPVPAQPRALGHYWESGYLLLFREIELNGKIVGTVYVKSDLNALTESIMTELGLAAVLMLVALAFAYILAARLQILISGPIQHLVEVTEQVSTKQDYTIRATKGSEDEIGQLISGFNEMLSQIQERDEALEKHRENLEGEVAARTAELSDVNTALRASETKTRSIVDAAADGIITFNSEGRVESLNTAAVNIFGYSEQELKGQHVSTFVLPGQNTGDSATGGDGNSDTAQAKLLGANGDVQGKRKDETTFVLDISVSEVELQNHSMFIGIMRDITEKKRAEEALLAAKEAAEAANQAKSDFLANMSHEIRTPMNGVIGMTELALETELTDQQKKYLYTVRQSAHSLLSIINDILDFSKIEAGKLEIEYIDFNIREMINETMRTVAPRFDQKGLELLCRVLPEVPEHTIGDPLRIRQVLVNLVGNACKFTDQGEVCVLVESEDNNDGEQMNLRFSVIDTGIGIAPDKLDSVFQSFSQADTSTTREYGGTGLGLTISRQLVGLMGGDMTVTSDLGKGSTFAFTVNCTHSSTPVMKNVPAEMEKLKDMHVLIVDDNPTNCTILEELLSIWGMQSTSVSGAAEALSELDQSITTAQTHYDMIISDFNMPKTDGLMLVEQIRKRKHFQQTPIIILSSADRMGNTARCRELEVSAYLLKPVMQPELLEVIRDVLGLRVDPVDTDTTSRLGGTVGSKFEDKQLFFLIAEDNPVNQEFIRSILELKGHKVVLADNGAELVEKFEDTKYFQPDLYQQQPKQEQPDIILMDIQMPKMGGVEACEIIREREQALGIHMPIIALTAHAMKGDREKYLGAGMNGYVTKPVDIKLLLQTVEDLLGPDAGVPKIDDQITEETETKTESLNSTSMHHTPNTITETTIVELEKMPPLPLPEIDADEPLQKRVEALMDFVQQLYEKVDELNEQVAKLITHQDPTVFTHLNGSRDESQNDSQDLKRKLHEMLDIPELAERVSGSVVLLKRIVQIFLDTCPQLLEELDQAIKSQVPDEVHAVAHNVKGMLGNLAAKSAFECSFELVRASRDGDLSEAPRLYIRLTDEVKQLVTVLEAILDSSILDEAVETVRGTT